MLKRWMLVSKSGHSSTMLPSGNVLLGYVPSIKELRLGAPKMTPVEENKHAEDDVEGILHSVADHCTSNMHNARIRCIIANNCRYHMTSNRRRCRGQ